MAELVPTKRTGAYSVGHKAQEIVELPAVANGDTFRSEIPNVEHAFVLSTEAVAAHSHIENTAAAYTQNATTATSDVDSITVSSISDDVVTFAVTGAARKATVIVVGF